MKKILFSAFVFISTQNSYSLEKINKDHVVSFVKSCCENKELSIEAGEFSNLRSNHSKKLVRKCSEVSIENKRSQIVKIKYGCIKDCFFELETAQSVFNKLNGTNKVGDTNIVLPSMFGIYVDGAFKSIMHIKDFNNKIASAYDGKSIITFQLIDKIDGIPLWAALKKCILKEHELFSIAGKAIGNLHKNNLIHGDLQGFSNNMLYSETSKEITIFDFDTINIMSEITLKDLAKKEILLAIHDCFEEYDSFIKEYSNAIILFSSLMNAYNDVIGEKTITANFDYRYEDRHYDVPFHINIAQNFFQGIVMETGYGIDNLDFKKNKNINIETFGSKINIAIQKVRNLTATHTEEESTKKLSVSDYKLGYILRATIFSVEPEIAQNLIMQNISKLSDYYEFLNFIYN